MDIRLIGAPLQIGAGQLGCEMGPSAYRIAGLTRALEDLGHRVVDTGNVTPAPLRGLATPIRRCIISLRRWPGPRR